MPAGMAPTLAYNNTARMLAFLPILEGRHGGWLSDPYS